MSWWMHRPNRPPDSRDGMDPNFVASMTMVGVWVTAIVVLVAVITHRF